MTKKPSESLNYWDRKKYCSIGCGSVGNKRNVGRVHSEKSKKNMSEAHKGKLLGEKSPLWKGENVGYGGLHAWIRRKIGKASSCFMCGIDDKKIKYVWANISGEYKRDVSDFINMCSKCHNLFDGTTDNLFKYRRL